MFLLKLLIKKMAEYLKNKKNYALCVFYYFFYYGVPLKHLALKKLLTKPTNNIIELLCQYIEKKKSNTKPKIRVIQLSCL